MESHNYKLDDVKSTQAIESDQKALLKSQLEQKHLKFEGKVSVCADCR